LEVELLLALPTRCGFLDSSGLGTSWRCKTPPLPQHYMPRQHTNIASSDEKSSLKRKTAHTTSAMPCHVLACFTYSRAPISGFPSLLLSSPRSRAQKKHPKLASPHTAAANEQPAGSVLVKRAARSTRARRACFMLRRFSFSLTNKSNGRGSALLSFHSEQTEKKSFFLVSSRDTRKKFS
jgi:hypothetical protein